jgi:hypothetical protein
MVKHPEASLYLTLSTQIITEQHHEKTAPTPAHHNLNNQQLKQSYVFYTI